MDRNEGEANMWRIQAELTNLTGQKVFLTEVARRGQTERGAEISRKDKEIVYRALCELASKDKARVWTDEERRLFELAESKLGF
jgi:hypothetical protein